MSNRLHFYRSLQTCLGGALLLLSVQSGAVAQAALGEDAASQQAMASPVTGLQPYMPSLDLPPLQPTLPEASAHDVRLVLRLRQRRVYVYQGDKLKVSYPVAIGRPGWETPTGQFRVLEMVQNPGWTNPFTREVVPPGPDNPLGERWIAFWTDGDAYVGFHGTPNRDSVGRAASHGCVRMLNENVRELYNMVTPGTLVTVEP